ncbi:MAG: chemotaxis protein CheR [Candidatus Cloacimonadota bacterium]|nr:MAG: chemotaxis protein CheR [Candidatus Cloacimonadota bacterium]
MSLASCKITDQEFLKFRKLVYEEFGINLTEKKKLLVVNRLQKVLRDKNLGSFTQYYDYIKRDNTNKSLSELINKISTNHTFFYRENTHFEVLRKDLLPKITLDLSNKLSKDLRIWCAGCSSGEESSTLMMIIKDVLGVDYNLWKAGLLATDICEEVLEFAKNGHYETKRIKELPVDLRNKYTEITTKVMSKIKNDVLSEITYRKFNLMHDFPFKKKFHVIFCRNVMIYFDQKTRKNLVNKFLDYLMDDGLLFIGHSESLSDVDDLIAISPSMYKKRGK